MPSPAPPLLVQILRNQDRIADLVREMVWNRDIDAQETAPDSTRHAFLSGTPSHKFWQCPSLMGPHFGDFLLKGSAVGLGWELVLLSCPPSLSLKALPLPKMRSEISLWFSLPSMYWLPASCPGAISHHPWYGPSLQATRSLGNRICPYHAGWHLPPLPPLPWYYFSSTKVF